MRWPLRVWLIAIGRDEEYKDPLDLTLMTQGYMVL